MHTPQPEQSSLLIDTISFINGTIITQAEYLSIITVVKRAV